MSSAAAASPAVGPDLLRFELIIAGGAPSGFEVDTTERVATFDNGARGGEGFRDERQGTPGSFARTKAQFAPYRALAGEACSPGPADVLQQRLIWREGGVEHTAIFADSCKGFPVDLDGRLRTLADIFDGPAGKAGAAESSPPAGS